MRGLEAALIGAAFGIGVLLIAAGCVGAPVVSLAPLRAGRLAAHLDRLLIRTSLAVAAAIGAFVLTHWIVPVMAASCAGWLAPTWRRDRHAHERELALVEGIAAWTEQVRDTVSAANGLEHALGATVDLAPAAVADAVERLASRSAYDGLGVALRCFADEVDHPTADFVVAALLIAHEKEARDLGALLGQLADAARDEARMRMRVWVGRARTRSAVHIIAAVVAVMIVGLLVFDRAYLAPYNGPGGQLVLGVVTILFVVAFVAMQRLGRIELPQRFVSTRVPQHALQGTASER